MFLQQTQSITDLPWEKMTTTAVSIIVLVSIILFFTYKICTMLCHKGKKNE